MSRSHCYQVHPLPLLLLPFLPPPFLIPSPFPFLPSSSLSLSPFFSIFYPISPSPSPPFPFSISFPISFPFFLLSPSLPSSFSPPSSSHYAHSTCAHPNGIYWLSEFSRWTLLREIAGNFVSSAPSYLLRGSNKL